MSDVIGSNSEILFIYDAKRCNPNGDFDNENKPRMDWEASRNLVSDVRLKRYIRDYFEEKDEFEIFVTEQAETAEDRVEQIIERSPTKSNPVDDDELKKILRKCKDANYFGIVLASTGANIHLTGPVQFNWGYSLNEIEELQESRTITSSFSSGEGVGKDYRVNYSFIAFSGAINARVAKTTNMTEDDLERFDTAMIEAIPLNRTRSKIGQFPRLYLRVEMDDHTTALNDLREFVELDTSVPEAELREIDECTLDASELEAYLNDNQDEIDTVHFWKDRNLDVSGMDFVQPLFEPIEV